MTGPAKDGAADAETPNGHLVSMLGHPPIVRPTNTNLAVVCAPCALGPILALAALLAVLPALSVCAQEPPTLAPEERELLESGPRGETTPGGRRMVVRPPGEEGEEGEGLLLVSEEGYFEYSEDANVVYANDRTTVHYKGMTLEADSLSLDIALEEITAVGNVILRSEGTEIEAERVRYSFKRGEGAAYEARGHYGPLFFRHSETETEGAPTFESISREESIFRNASVTTSPFVIPMYRLRAREILLYPNERVFLKGAVLYIREVPLMYFPFYTKSLDESSPWLVRVGYKSKIGAWARLGYSYNHMTKVPSMTEDDVMETKSRGHLTVFADYLSQRGFGTGLRYRYSFGFGRHHGEADLYGLFDGDRNIDGREKYTTIDRTRDAADNIVTVPGSARTRRTADEDDELRYQALLKHRSQITENIDWLLNVDWVSDPELYDEVLDIFREDERKRVMERRARTALTWARDSFVARLMFEVQDRIGRDRITDFSDPGDYARDYDEQPEIVLSDRDDEAIPTSRWGRTTVRAPQLVVESTWVKLWNLPLYYHTDLNVFNNLDRGLNTVDEDDDAYVRGFDWYHALMWRWRIAQRYTLLAKVGGGGGVAIRESGDFDYYDQQRFDSLALLGYHNYIPDPTEGGLEFTDPETFIVGDEEYSLDDVDDGFGYGDAMLRLNARFTQALTGDLIYRFRETTDHHLGDWYAEMGNRMVLDDLYNFRLREHNINGILRYALARPDLSVGTRAFYNLISDSELFPNEVRSYYGVWSAWRNAAQTVTVDSAIGLSERQIYHPSDPRAFIDSAIGWRGGVGYRPLSKLWWTEGSMSYEEELDQDVGDRTRDRFTEDYDRFEVEGKLGGRIGPKWTAQIGAEYDSRASGIHELDLTFERDLHDAMLLMSVGLERNIYDDDDDDNESLDGSLTDDIDFQFAIRPKLPGSEEFEGVPGIETIRSAAKSITPEEGE